MKKVNLVIALVGFIFCFQGQAKDSQKNRKPNQVSTNVGKDASDAVGDFDTIECTIDGSGTSAAISGDKLQVTLSGGKQVKQSEIKYKGKTIGRAVLTYNGMGGVNQITAFPYLKVTFDKYSSTINIPFAQKNNNGSNNLVVEIEPKDTIYFNCNQF